MRATPLLAAVAAGLFSFAATAQEVTNKTNAPDAPAHASSPPQPTVIVAVPSSDGSSKPAGDGKVTAAVASAPAAPSVPAAPLTVRRPTAPTLIAKINLSTQRLQLTYDGRQQESWPISSGREGYATPRGVFRPQWASKMWYSRKYDNAPMPNAVFFSGGVAVHGTNSIGMLGSPASHGCVRLAPGNAARFYSLVHKHGFGNTRIEVLGSPPASRVARREPLGAYGRQANVTAYGYGARTSPPGRYQQGWMPPTQQPTLRRSANGLVYLPQGSPYRGQSSFVLNGVTYVRVR